MIGVEALGSRSNRGILREMQRDKGESPMERTSVNRRPGVERTTLGTENLKTGTGLGQRGLGQHENWDNSHPQIWINRMRDSIGVPNDAKPEQKYMENQWKEKRRERRRERRREKKRERRREMPIK